MDAISLQLCQPASTPCYATQSNVKKVLWITLIVLGFLAAVAGVIVSVLFGMHHVGVITLLGGGLLASLGAFFLFEQFKYTRLRQAIQKMLDNLPEGSGESGIFSGKGIEWLEKQRNVLLVKIQEKKDQIQDLKQQLAIGNSEKE